MTPCGAILYYYTILYYTMYYGMYYTYYYYDCTKYDD